MAAATPPLPGAVFEQHLRVNESLRALGRHHRRVTSDPTSRFLGMTPDEFDAALQGLSRRAPPDSLFIELDRRSPGRTRLLDIIDVWKMTTGQAFKDFAPLMKRRHWLAHGRSWSDKSGYRADPQLVFNLITSVFRAIQARSPDFPRV